MLPLNIRAEIATRKTKAKKLKMVDDWQNMASIRNVFATRILPPCQLELNIPIDSITRIMHGCFNRMERQDPLAELGRDHRFLRLPMRSPLSTEANRDSIHRTCSHKRGALRATESRSEKSSVS